MIIVLGGQQGQSSEDFTKEYAISEVAVSRGMFIFPF